MNHANLTNAVAQDALADLERHGGLDGFAVYAERHADLNGLPRGPVRSALLRLLVLRDYRLEETKS